MFKPFPLYVGLRNFTSGSRNRLVSFISLLAILGLVLGVALLIVVMSVMNGFDHEMEARILGAVPHVRLFKDGGIEDVPALMEVLETQENVRATMPFNQVEGMLTSRGKTRPVEVLGIDGALSGEFIGQFVLPELLTSLQGSEKTLLLAKGVADKLMVSVGDRVTLLVPRAGVQKNRQLAPTISAFTVGGIFETHTTIDQHLALAQLDVVGALRGTGTRPQGIQVKLNDIFQVRQTGFDLLRVLAPGYRFSDWIQTHGNLYQAIRMSRNMVSLLVFLIIGIAVFNVISMLMMTVLDKRSAIAILKTLGATNSEIVTVFLTQGFLIGAVGSLLGAIIGISCAWKVSAIVSGIESLLGFHFLSSDVYPIDYLPSALVWSDVLLIVAVALGLNFLATLYPALRAARTRPAEVLRYE
ncbi:MAG: lipoprotein-releasing ABC transporter permease subunit [Porticoccus sp.]|nr:lipoprotein-releasing ABC transporter permease subunit [Porticoccus sp.]MBQ0806555.1 lipoprotein-releasing ABC transporter permease subunit [Porticoccus sp.]